jgi:hypothetical protein
MEGTSRQMGMGKAAAPASGAPAPNKITNIYLARWVRHQHGLHFSDSTESIPLRSGTTLRLAVARKAVARSGMQDEEKANLLNQLDEMIRAHAINAMIRHNMQPLPDLPLRDQRPAARDRPPAPSFRYASYL